MNSASVGPPSSSHALRHAIVAIAWAVFVTYGSLVPLDFRPHPDALQAFLHIRWLHLGVGSRADWVANIILYAILAYFVSGAVWSSRLSLSTRLVLHVLALGASLALAVGIEYLQLYFPPRTVSLNDLLAESIGIMLGALCWFVSGQRIAAIWEHFVSGGIHSTRALLALYAIGYFAFSFFPYDFLVSTAEFASKLAKPVSLSLGPGQSCGKPFICEIKFLAEMVLVLPFGVLLALHSRHRKEENTPHKKTSFFKGFTVGVLIGILVEGVQIVLASGTTQAISIVTRGIGAAWGVGLANNGSTVWRNYSPAFVRRIALLALLPYLAIVLALNDIVPLRLQPLWAATEKLRGLHYLPFYYHYYTTETAAVRSLLFIAGSFAPIGAIAALAWPQWRATTWMGPLIAALLCLGIEALKLFFVGKHPDPTNPLIAAASAWLLHWITSKILRVGHFLKESPHTTIPKQSFLLRHSFLVQVVAPIVVLLTIVTLSAPSNTWSSDDNTHSVTLPPPEALTLAALPSFREAHPRLPTPSETDLSRLSAHNPAYIEGRRNNAQEGVGDMESSIFMALAEPGSQNLSRLHQRLIALKFTGRGNEQVKPLSLAYDWLYPQWTQPERAALKDKLSQGCSYTIDIIRKEAFSPYNVDLYSGPLQALMACSIALYKDHPRGETYMAFTQELWKNRVLPVWRQILGRNGGWHEGGEYVAIGIGQAIYVLPAMWRTATNEDFFKSEPGIRGFLDFLIYRNRPDGTQFRWGDGADFTRTVPDALPLAIEFRHKAAYSLSPPDKLVPTAWPWGPLSDDTLIDTRAIEQLPSSRLFDGIGMLVARSDWTPDATYVTFKAGDNYWSHSHLDQGAFTLYKGGELAIDSGWHGPSYGSGHHMNYAYQSIAHNLVTVTDPNDVQPGPGFDTEPRPYANDGGQRRIGSGWGVESAPIDRLEWENQRENYHTATIIKSITQGGLNIVVADLTPAYTNEHSGRGTFSNRTKRVERLWRTFSYDQVNDAIVVFDDVISTDQSFRKRWLLHSISEPVLTPNGFTIDIPRSVEPGHQGGHLEAHILSPTHPLLNSIGGVGFEFFVDGKNYNKNVEVRESRRQLRPGQGEPGAWRIELSPSQENKEDQFLVVLLPTIEESPPKKTVRRLEANGFIGVEVTGPNRTTRWWYQPGRQGVRAEIIQGSKTTSLDLLAPP